MENSDGSILTMPRINYKGITEDDAKKLTYLLTNCFELAEGKLENITLVYDNGFLLAQGMVYDRAPKTFTSRCIYDEKSLTVVSSIKEGEDEARSTTDTFYFDPDDIRIISSNPYFAEPITRNIDYLSEHRTL